MNHELQLATRQILTLLKDADTTMHLALHACTSSSDASDAEVWLIVTNKTLRDATQVLTYALEECERESKHLNQRLG